MLAETKICCNFAVAIEAEKRRESLGKAEADGADKLLWPED